MKTKINTTLLASSPSLDGISNCITSFYFNSPKELIEIEPNIWSVSGKNGTIQNVRVIKKGKRYRFESINPPAV